ncbi:MAG: PKD domain-containing protein, partial [Nanoarchaeota archaeon]
MHNPPKIISFTPPKINLSLVEGSSTLFNVVAEDLDTPPDLPLSYEWMFDEDIVSTDDTFQYKAGFNDSGIHKISVSVNDTTGMKTEVEWNLTVNNTNRNPDFYMVFVEDINEDENAVFELVGSDEDAQFGDKITYSVNDSRVTISRINDTSANATWTPTNDDVGTHQFNFSARDDPGGEISKIISVNVSNTNDAPVIKTYHPQVDKLTIAENERVEFNISFEDVDKNDQDQVTWYLNQDIVKTGANKLVVENLQDGKYTVNVTVEDTNGDKATRTWELIVSDTPVSSLYTGSIFNIPEENLGNATNVTINQSSFGVIDFGSQELNLSDVVDIDNNVIIAKGVVGINTEKYSELNKSAKIFMNGLGFTITPKIFYNKGFGIAENTECPADLCSNVIYNLSTGTLGFNVAHFSTFFVQQGNSQPIANAGQDQSINVNNLVTLDGSASIDPDNDALRFNWTQISGNNVTLSNFSAQRPTFTPSKVGVYTFRLIVNDDTLDSLPDDVTISTTENEEGKVLDITDVEVESDGNDEELKPGEKLKVRVEIANKGDVDIKDITLKVFFKSKSGGTLEDDDGDEVEDESEFDLDAGDDEDDLDEDDVTFTFDMPFDVDDGDKFIVYVTADGTAQDDSSLKFSDIDSSETIEFVREKHELSIFRASINPTTIKCERTINVNLGIKNIGEEDEDVMLSFSASELGISEKQECSLESDPDADENTFTRAFSYNLPENVDSGVYTIPVNVEFDDGSETETMQLSLTVEDCEKQSVKKKPIAEDVGLKVVPKKEVPKEEVIFYPIKSPEKKVVTEVKFTDTSTYLVLLASSF